MNQKLQILESYEKERFAFLSEVSNFPVNKKEQRLFSGGVDSELLGNLNLKQVLAHILCWETYVLDLIGELNSGQEPTDIYETGLSAEKYSKNFIDSYESVLWQEVSEELIEAGATILESVASMSEELFTQRLFASKPDSFSLAVLLQNQTLLYKNYLAQLKQM